MNIDMMQKTNIVTDAAERFLHVKSVLCIKETVFEVPSDPTIKKCVINKEVVTGKESPYLVHTGGRKNSRKKNQKKMAS